MGYEQGPSLAGSRIIDADFSNARLHAANFEGAKITDAWLRDADISGDLEGLRLNGVEVAPLVTAELERLFPERAKLRATDPDGLAEAWAMVEGRWEATVARARALPESSLFERVDDEWSFVETLRHLIMATDCWLRRMVKGMEHPYHPWGLAGFPLPARTVGNWTLRRPLHSTRSSLSVGNGWTRCGKPSGTPHPRSWSGSALPRRHRDIPMRSTRC